MLSRLFILTWIPWLVLGLESVAQSTATSKGSVISYVDTELTTAQKYVLRVDGRPFYMTNVQIRLDKLRYQWGWNAVARDSIIGQAASDGFNTVSIPIHWYEVEKSKDKFDWNTLDEYLMLINKHNIKMELLWFGQNSGGHTQWLSDTHLRVPDYVLFSPAKSSPATTSQYKFRRDQSNYTLDLADSNLVRRESYVLSKVMAHLAEWDKSHGQKHPVIGVQLGNEVAGADFNGMTFTSAQVIAYMNQLGRAVKASPYRVWTRLNCVWGMEIGRIEVNESLRALQGTSIDFVGIDLYEVTPSTMRTVLPYKGKNYRMIMESGARDSLSAQYQLAALSGNTAYDYYEMCGPDDHGLYDRMGKQGFVPFGRYIDEVRIVNKLLTSDLQDIALKASGYDLFVHNWAANSTQQTQGVAGITFTPAAISSQAISIRRSPTELVLMNTKGGAFQFPDSLGITEASIGYFDQNNTWVAQRPLAFTRTSAAPPPGVTVRLIGRTAGTLKSTRMQAEFASYGLGSFVESQYVGFAGNGYINLLAKGGVIHWTAVDGQMGGAKTIRFRYANGSHQTHSSRVLINGKAYQVAFPPTGSWESYTYASLNVPLNRGQTNMVRVEATEEGAGLIDELEVF